jgi:transposase
MILFGMFPTAKALQVDRNQKKRLRFLARAGKTPQKIALRARIILGASEGLANNAIAGQLGISRPTVLLWRNRFERFGVSGLLKDAKRTGRKKAIAPEVVQQVVEATLHTTPKGATHWTTRSMAQAQKLSHMTVQRIWKQHGLQPHRLETFKLSQDPRFVEKLRDVVGLYLNPPAKALVLSVDEKSQIQALDRTRPLLPLRPGLPARQTHAYKRHGTTTLYAALSLLDGTVIGECKSRHRAKEFIDFLHTIDRQTPAELELHLIVDNSSTHRTVEVRKWLARHPRFQLHFTPTSSSWLNLVERWFGEITRKRIRRGTFTSVAELIAAIEEYIAVYNQKPIPFVWTKNADMILKKIDHCKRASVTPH